MIENEKQVLIVAGANGVGKTTFALQFLEEYEDYEFLNADEIAKQLSADAPAARKISAGKMFFQKLKETVAQNKSLLIESTLSGHYLEDYFEIWRENGYQIQIIFIFVESVDISIARIAERVAKGGHFVPNEDVARRFERGKRNFWQIYKNLADAWNLFYNSEDNFNLAAIGEADNIFIVDQNLFDKFFESTK